MTTDHRKAPRRKILTVTKTGSWGNVTYRHELSCGHIETRKRAATSEDIACAWCFRTRQKNVEMKALIRGPFSLVEEPDLSLEEMRIDKTKAALSTRFNVPLDAVDVVAEDINGKLVIKNAVIYLSPLDVEKLTRSQ
jgi:hypothetical protein